MRGFTFRAFNAFSILLSNNLFSGTLGLYLCLNPEHIMEHFEQTKMYSVLNTFIYTFALIHIQYQSKVWTHLPITLN